MRRLFFIITLLFCSSFLFAERSYILGGFSLAFDVQEEDELYEYSMPLTLGGFLEINNFGENCYGDDKYVGFQAGFFFNCGLNEDEGEYTSTLSFATLLAPVLRVSLRDEKLLLFSAGVASGIDFGGCWTEGEENERKDASVFQAFAGLGAQAAMVLSNDFSFGANFFYNPLCYTSIDVKDEGKENDVRSFGNMFRIGVFIAFCLRD